jgi:hypothetical protein
MRQAHNDRALLRRSAVLERDSYRSRSRREEIIRFEKLTAEKFAEGIWECLVPKAKEKAAELAKCIAAEGDGAENMINSFHAHLPLEGEHSMRCSIFEDRVAVLTVKHTGISLSRARCGHSGGVQTSAVG